MKRNGKIEILRFFFCISVIFYHVGKDIWKGEMVFADHFTLFGRGRTAVEFFFLLTGFLMAKKAYSVHKTRTASVGVETVNFLSRKIKSVIAPYITISLVTIIYALFVTEDFVTYVIERAPSLLFLQRTGIADEAFITVGWYLGSMFFAIAVIYPFLIKAYDNVSLIAAPVISSMLIGYFIHENQRMPQSKFGLYIHESNLRAIAVILLGVFAFRVCMYLKDMKLSKPKRALLAAVENICWIISIHYVVSNTETVYEGHITYVMAIALTISFSRDMSCKLYNSSVVTYLGRISLPIYLSQTLPRMVVYFHFSNATDWIKVVIVISGSIFLGVLYDVCERAYKNFKSKAVQ
ncbi:MAG: acyltransferase [Ruminococcaceae bacterium]|nr:acyltransferase [Oscillospiraceae bacterium]